MSESGSVSGGRKGHSVFIEVDESAEAFFTYSKSFVDIFLECVYQQTCHARMGDVLEQKTEGK